MASLLQVARGASLGGVVTGGALALALLLGIAPGANRLVFVLVALATLAYCMIPSRSLRLARVGASAVSILGVVSGIVTGFGWLEAALVIGGLFAWGTVGREPKLIFRPVPTAAVALAIVFAALIPLIIGGETLGHDEAAYALKGRTWLEGAPDSGWSLHRGPVLSGYAYVVLALGGEEAALRLVGILGLAGLAIGTGWLGRRLFNTVVGVFAALVMVAGPAVLRRATEFLTDIPAAALLVVSMAMVWNEFENRPRGPSYRLLWVLPVAWLAFYLRYQSILAFGLIGVTMLILWWPRIKARPGPVIAAASLGVAGLVPHAVFAFAETESPIGILVATGNVAGREFIGEGLVDYALLLGWPLAGLVGLPLVVFFLWWLGRAWSDPEQRRRALFLAVPALGQVVALGLVSHGEARFVFFPLALVAVGAAAGLSEISRSWRPRLRLGMRAGLIVLLFGSMVLAIVATRGSVENRILSNEAVEMSSEHVEASSEGAECGVMTSYLPQVTYYSECSTAPFRTSQPADEAVDRLVGDEKFMILVEDGKRQPIGDDLQELLEETDGEQFLVQGQRESAVVYEFED